MMIPGVVFILKLMFGCDCTYMCVCVRICVYVYVYVCVRVDMNAFSYTVHIMLVPFMVIYRYNR